MARLAAWFLAVVALVPTAAAAGRRNVASLIINNAVFGSGVVPSLAATASPWIERVISPDPGSPDVASARRAYLSLGLLHDAQGRSELAIRDWRQARSAGLWGELADRAWRLGRPEDALTLHRRALAVDPEDFEHYFRLAWVLWPGTGQTAAAIEVYRAVAARAATGTFERALAEGQICRLQQDWPGALDNFEQAARLDPRREDPWRLAAAAAVKTGDLPRAIAHLQQAVRASPLDSAISIELGDASRDAGELGEASRAYSEATRLQPDNLYAASGHASVGDRYLAQGAYADAIHEFTLAIATGPATGRWHRSLAEALEGRGRLREALASYRRAVDLDPSDAAARRALARLEGRVIER